MGCGPATHLEAFLSCVKEQPKQKVVIDNIENAQPIKQTLSECMTHSQLM